MDRITLILAAAVAIPLVGILVYSGVTDVHAEEKLWLKTQLIGLDTTGPQYASLEQDFAAWRQKMDSRPTAWKPITEEPPPPPPKKKAPPKCPDINQMLNGVSPKMSGIGDKIKIVTPDNSRGGWYVVGDAINGCSITEITRDTVVFTHHCAARNELLTAELTRERR